MLYAIVAYPKVDFGKINDFRKKYDPHFSLIKPHITVAFPFQDTIPEGEIIKHIESRVEEIRSFQITISSYDKFFDHWLYLIISNGKQEVTKLHDVLYTDILEKYLRKDLPFIQHITIGLFSKKYLNSVSIDKNAQLDEEKYKKALRELKDINLNINADVEKVTLVKLNEDFTYLTDIKDFDLREA